LSLWFQGGEPSRILANSGADLMNAAQEKPIAECVDAPVPSAKPVPASAQTDAPAVPPHEIGGRDGPEPTRYGDWEKAGRCIDF
jgi:hypothetical protein